MNLDTIGDNDLFTGRELKRMLREALAQGASTAWVKLDDAAETLEVKPSTLRKRCERWAEMAKPPVRVQKTSAGRNAHWLLHASDVQSLTPRRTRADSEPRTLPADDSEDALAAHWCELVTRNL